MERARGGTISPRSGSAVSRGPSKGELDVRQVQVALKDQGQNPGPIDGIMGSRTQAALREFQKANGLQQTGILDEVTMRRLAPDR